MAEKGQFTTKAPKKMKPMTIKPVKFTQPKNGFKPGKK